MNPVRWPVAVLTVAATALAVSPPASATPGRDVSAEILSQATLNGHDYIVREITIAPGGSTGWHWHDGRIFGVIQAGTLTHNNADCTVDGIYSTGDPITEETGPNHVHIGRNLGPDPLVLQVVYIDPAGSPLSEDAPEPGGDYK